MENWNWQQILGFAILIAGGFVGLIFGLKLLSSLLCPEYSTAALIALMSLIGACLWIFGKRKGRKKRIS